MEPGNAIATVLRRTGAAPVVKRLIKRVTGRPCRCVQRQAALNRLFGRRPRTVAKIGDPPK